MTEVTIQSPQTGGMTTHTEEIPGISAAELEVMQAAAARFLGSQDNDSSQDVGTVTAQMQALREPADALAAGAVSVRRDIYMAPNSRHFMAMPLYES